MKYILIDHIRVQNVNAIAGFTWGFPAITHFLGFCHNLSRKLIHTNFDIQLNGCAVICHAHQSHTYGSSYNLQFTQSRNPAYLKKDVGKLVNGGKTPSVIEEGKMNMAVSFLVGYDGNIGNQEENFKDWLYRQCMSQRLAGGSILSIDDINIHGDDPESLRHIKFTLLPGFILMDRSEELKIHYNNLLEMNTNTELLDAWLDFSALKQKARPKSDLIGKHLNDLVKTDSKNKLNVKLLAAWNKHLGSPYEENKLPIELADHFAALENSNTNKTLLEQWQTYCSPDENTDAEWEYVPKPATGYLVPIMTGYKAISQVYENHLVENTRDNETDVCFVEAVHSVGEWKSVHRLRDPEELCGCLWNYVPFEENWYLCQQGTKVDSASDETVGWQSTPDEYEEDYN